VENRAHVLANDVIKTSLFADDVYELPECCFPSICAHTWADIGNFTTTASQLKRYKNYFKKSIKPELQSDMNW